MSSRRTSPARRVLAATVPLALSALLVSGCSDLDQSSADPTPTPSPTGAALPTDDPTEGIDVEGSGYSLTVPSGWAETTDQVKARYRQVDASAGDTAVTGGFADNINVIVSDKRRIKTQRKAERILREDLGQVGRRIRIEDPGELDGETAYHATARLKVGRIRVRTSQYFAKHDDTWYLLTFSYGPQTEPQTEAEEVQAMLDSWSWKD